MRYLDTGGRNPQECLGDWLTKTLQDQGIKELRLQTGYFSLNGASLLMPILGRFAKADCTTKILIGSNDGCTLKNDVVGLMQFMDIPRANGHLGIVSFAGAYFHPKTYHVCRQDGTEAAFVGSANLTSAGLTLNVEAGITLDSREGDPPHQLSQIAAAIDAWFNDQRDGLTLVTGIGVLNELASRGVLVIVPPPKLAESSKGEGGASSGDARHGSSQSFRFPLSNKSEFLPVPHPPPKCLTFPKKHFRRIVRTS